MKEFISHVFHVLVNVLLLLLLFNENSNRREPDRLKRDNPDARVTAQHYRSTHCASITVRKTLTNV